MPVELDVYNWEGQGRDPGYGWDLGHCPDLKGWSLLTDQPVESWISFPNGGHSNWSDDYPADAEPWLIPMFAGTIPSYPPPDAQAARGRDMGYRLRVRGHLDDPFFSQCAHAERIFCD